MTLLHPHFPKVIDASMRSDWNSCQRKAYWHYFRKKIPLRESEHLVAGSAYAVGLEVFRKTYYGEERGFDLSLINGARALIKAYGEFDCEDNSKPWDRVLAAYESYLAYWHPEKDYVKPHILNGIPTVEFSFALPLDLNNPETGEPILYAGRFDMLACYHDLLFVEDDKTTKSLGKAWSNKWDLRSQFSGYCWGAQQFGHPVVGAIIRGTGILKTKITHAEAIVYREKFIIERWYERLMWDVERMVETWNRGEYFTTGEESEGCEAYGGCPYKMLCQSKTPETWLDGYYRDDDWSPIGDVTDESLLLLGK